MGKRNPTSTWRNPLRSSDVGREEESFQKHPSEGAIDSFQTCDKNQNGKERLESPNATMVTGIEGSLQTCDRNQNGGENKDTPESLPPEENKSSFQTCDINQIPGLEMGGAKIPPQRGINKSQEPGNPAILRHQGSKQPFHQKEPITPTPLRTKTNK